MKTRPFGSVGWGLMITLSFCVIFAISTFVFLSSSAGQAPRDATGSNLRIARLANGLASVSPPALAIGRFLASGQPEDMRNYLSAMAALQADVRSASATFAGNQAAADQFNQLDQHIVRAITMGRQVAAQPGAGLLNAGGPGSVEQVGATALAAVKAGLEDLLKVEIDRAPVATVAPSPTEKPEFSVWVGGWSAAAALLVGLMLITALRQEDSETATALTVAPQSSQKAYSPPARQEAAQGGMLASVSRELELAHLDSLTGLLNRSALAPTVEKAIEWSLRKGVTIGMIYVEIDGFKTLKQKLGPSLSNALIMEVGKQLKDTFRRNDQVARLRDAEFAVVVTEISGREILTRLEQRIQEAIADIRMPALHGVRVKASIGLAMYPIDGYSDHDLLETARNIVLYGDGKAPVEALASIPAPQLHVAPPVAGPAQDAQPPEPVLETVEAQVDASLQELHAMIGKYLESEHGSAEKHAQAQALIGEFKRRG